MIGNDVVDLRDPESAPGVRHPRFDARVFAPAEHARLAARPVRAHSLRWALWAAKEATYKLARRLDARTVFAPRAFVVDPEAGEVRYGGERFALALDVDDERVHAVVTVAAGLDGKAVVSAAVTHDGEREGPAARALALRTLSLRLRRPARALSIGRDGRIPTLESAGRRLPVPLSLSHHGRFVAFAAALPVDA